jgi:hypothetical protein
VAQLRGTKGGRCSSRTPFLFYHAEEGNFMKVLHITVADSAYEFEMPLDYQFNLNLRDVAEGMIQQLKDAGGCWARANYRGIIAPPDDTFIPFHAMTGFSVRDVE